jgi:hypothetical protein
MTIRHTIEHLFKLLLVSIAAGLIVTACSWLLLMIVV